MGEQVPSKSPALFSEDTVPTSPTVKEPRSPMLLKALEGAASIAPKVGHRAPQWREETAQTPRSVPAPPRRSAVVPAMVIFPHKALAPNQHTTFSGQVLIVAEHDPKGWSVVMVSGKRGLVPGKGLKLTKKMTRTPRSEPMF